MPKDLKNLENIINYKFKDSTILHQCLTHKSFDPLNNNEKLEFLGDRVLGLIISEKLLELYPNYNEGKLDKKFASLVNRKKCLEISKIINLEKFIITGNKGKKIIIEDKIISDACEALIGGIYLDRGIGFSRKFILKFWNKDLNLNDLNLIDSKTKLQEYSLKIFKKLPEYKLLSNTGPRHKPLFKIAVKLPNTKFVSASGNSKKDAEQNAAKLLLKDINI
jgi:ribonuclease-3|tara:strand:- start:2343 stop:3005 length:663 start_codon:yes stop_codon:yes gene_type:complete